MTYKEWEENKKKILNESPGGLPSFQQLEDESFGTLTLVQQTIVGGMPGTMNEKLTIEERFQSLVESYRLMWYFRNSDKRLAETNKMMWEMEMRKIDELLNELVIVNKKYSELARMYYELEVKNE